MANQNTVFPNGNSPSEPVFIRPANLWDYEYIGLNAANTYDNTPLTVWLSPNRNEHWMQYVRGFRYRALARMVDPRNLTLVACKGSPGGKVVGHIQAERMGNDAGAKAYINSRWSPLLIILGWVLSVWWKALGLLVGDKSSHEGNLMMFLKTAAEDEKLYWEDAKRKSRWHVQSCVVLKEFQGRGVGRRLLESITAKAEEEGVVVGLEASEEGEHLYLKCGFKLLGRFRGNFGAAPGKGGVMLWSPTGKKRV